MKLFDMIIWLFPIIFMVHDFEEIVFIKAYQRKNKAYIQSLKGKKYIPFDLDFSTEVFSIAVGIEFILFSAVTILSWFFNSYVVWYIFFTGFTAHLVFHLIIWIMFKKYVPATVTSILFTPLCCYFVYKITVLLGYTLPTALILLVISGTLFLGWIYIMHKGMKTFAKLIYKYEETAVSRQ